MLVVVTAVSLCVQVYSLGYMHGDERFTWFYVVLSLFTAAMLTVVVSNNLIQLLVGWEVMGVCSYLLIGHWWEVKENSNAAIKAFITTRVGDIPFMFGIIMLIALTGFETTNITVISHELGLGEASPLFISMAAILLFGGTVGKSAQFPLHVWLPDAMAGPTPVSALIHAATMVAAGVYLIGRLFEVFLEAEPWVLTTVSIVGAITALGAAVLAIVQNDIKRVLAYSTLSQLAYMVAGLSLGEAGLTAGFFHLFTHAFFKALLFLGRGLGDPCRALERHERYGRPAPVDADHVLDDADRLPGTRRHLPARRVLVEGRTARRRARGARELALRRVHRDGRDHRLLHDAHGAAHVLRGVQGPRAPARVPPTMTGPLIALAAATIGVGLLGSPQLGAVFGQWVLYEEIHEAVFVPWIALLSTAGALLGLFAGFALYRERKAQDPLQAPLGPVWNVLDNRYYIDDFYMRAIVYPIRDTWSAGVNWFNQVVIDGVVNGAAALARGLGQAVAWFDRTVIDGIVNGAGEGAGRTGNVLKYLQTGNVQWYAVGLFVGVIALSVIFIRVV